MPSKGKDPADLLKCGEDLKDHYESLWERFDSAFAVCDLDELDAVQSEANHWALYGLEYFPQELNCYSPFRGMAIEAQKAKAACVAPRYCEKAGCPTGPPWDHIDQIVNERYCIGLRTLRDACKADLDAIRSGPCPEVCARVVEDKLTAVESALQEICGEEPPPPLQPVAAFTYTVHPRDGKWDVDFYDQSVSDENDPITKWEWDFGDGYGHTYRNPSHTYRAPGVYTVSLFIETESGQQAAHSEIIKLE